jgi:hypothetical protein
MLCWNCKHVVSRFVREGVAERLMSQLGVDTLLGAILDIR